MFLPRVMWVPKGQGRSITQPGFSERLEIDGVKESQKESAGELEYCTKKKDVRPVVEPLVEPVRKKVKLAKAELQYLPINAVPICVKAGVSSEPKCSSEGNVKDAGSTPLDVPETSGKTCSVGQSGEENVKSPNHVAKIGRKDSQMEQNDVYHARTFTVVINKPYVDIMSKANPSPLRSPHLVKTRHQCGKKPVHYTPIRRGQHLASTWRKLHGEEKTDQNNRSLLSARFAKLRNKNAPKEQTVANNSPEKTTSGIPVPPVHEWLSSFFGTSISYGSSHSDTGGSTDDDSSFVKLRSMLKALQTGNIDQLKAGDGGDLATYKGGKNMKLSEEEIPTSCAEDMELIDWKQLMCLLCKRKFNCKEALLSHQQFSNLHQSNLEFKRRALEEELKVLEMELDPSSSSSVFPCT
ncbi:protein transport [Branchiostoma belcheri]|nr:protein transport [Branchiostoma belcheri]